MGRDANNGPVPPSGTTGRVAHRLEPDRLVLTTPRLGIAFSSAHGAIVAVTCRQTQTELVNTPEAIAEGILWRLEIGTDGGDAIAVSSRACAEFHHSVDTGPAGEARCQLQWTGLRVGATRIEGRVTVRATLTAQEPTLWLDLSIQLPEHLRVRSAAFPCLWALGAADLLSDGSVFLPLAGGVLVHEPRAALAAPGGEHGWRAPYPGPASMQMFGYSVGDRATAWLGAADASGARKDMVVARMPRSNRLALWMTQYPTRSDAGDWSTGYRAAVGVVTGDWFDAAREYRAWASEQAWCSRGGGGGRDLPPLTRASGLWLSHWGDAQHAASATRELQRVANVPVKLDWRCWHKCACDGAYPDYFPPRDGEEAFARTKRHLVEAGVLSQLGFNGLLASPDSEAWSAEGAERYRVRAADDDAPGRQGLMPMCPSTRYWRQKLISFGREAVRRGSEGIYLADLGASGPFTCHDTDHGHGTGTPGSWAAGVRMALGELKAAVGRDIQVAIDGPAETYLDVADAFLSSHAAAERDALFPEGWGTRVSPIPLFASAFHDYGTVVGPPVSLVNHRPHDPMWGEDPAGLRLPAQVMVRDYQGQFCLEIARAAVWGQQIMLTDFSPEQARSDSNRRKLAFLSSALRAQAWGIGALLPYSEFMGMLPVDAHQIELSLLVNPPRSSPAERRTDKGSLVPVLGSAWRTPGGGAATVLVNIHDQPVEFATRLRSSRLALKLPLQFIGRTFSEDGDVPAASLRGSGSEISGRVPGRSVVLLTLR